MSAFTAGSPVFSAPRKFWCVVSRFYLSLRMFLFLLWFLLWSVGCLRCVSLHNFVNRPVFRLLLTSDFILLWLEKVLGMRSIFLVYRELIWGLPCGLSWETCRVPRAGCCRVQCCVCLPDGIGPRVVQALRFLLIACLVVACFFLWLDNIPLWTSPGLLIHALIRGHWMAKLHQKLCVGPCEGPDFGLVPGPVWADLSVTRDGG